MTRERKRRKLVFFDFATHYGGSRQSTLVLARELQKYCDVVILDAYGTCAGYIEAIKRYGIRYIVVQPSAKRTYVGGLNKIDRWFRVIRNSGEMLIFINRLRRILKEVSPNVISVNAYKSFFFISRAVGKKIPITYYLRVEGAYPRFYNKYDWKNISLFTGLSESCFSKLRNSVYNTALTAVVPNGIDIDEITNLGSVEPKNIPTGEGLRVLIPASLYENKSQDTAIKGLAEYLSRGGDACLWLAGDIAPGAPKHYEPKLRSLVGQLGLSKRVHFLGWRDDLPSLTSACDIVALTSHSESFGRVFLEAMCLEKPVIGTRAGGIPETFRDGIEGRLIEVDDSNGFAAALEQLSHPELRWRMGQAGRERVKSCFDIKVIAPRYYELISKIC